MEQSPLEKIQIAGGSESLLLAEDEKQLRELAYSVLAHAGYHVYLASDGDEALEIFQEHARDITLLILDVVMPKQSGKAVYEAAKKIDPDIKCLFISGYSQDQLHRDYILEENLHLLQKPYSRTDLLRLIRQVLDK